MLMLRAVRLAMLLAWSGVLAPPLASSAWAQRIPCTEVVHEMNRLSGTGQGRGSDADHLARRLNTSPLWVEKCAATYGRRLQHDSTDSDERLRRQEEWEAEESTEEGRDEIEARGERLDRSTHARDRSRARSLTADTEAWEPVEHAPWEPDVGHVWNPDLQDYRREPQVKIPGAVTD